MHNVLFPIVPKSCDEIWQQGGATSGYFEVAPDGSSGVQPFPVYCDFSTGHPQTLVHHNKERINTVSWDRYASSSSEHRVVVSYANIGKSISISQLSALVDLFENCHYTYVHMCLYTSLHESGWLTRTGVEKNNWADSSTICKPSMYILYFIFTYVSLTFCLLKFPL